MTRRLPDAIAQRMKQPAEQPGERRHRNVAKLLTRLQPKAPSFVPRKGSEGHREVWDIEDGVTIAGALGAVAAKGPGPAFAVTVLCLRWWPEYVFGPEVARAGVKETIMLPGRAEVSADGKVKGFRQTQVQVDRGYTRRQSFRPALLPLLGFANHGFARKLPWDTMPDPIEKRVHGAHERGELVACLLDEYVNPNHCIRCHGYGQVLRTKNEDGQPAPVAIVDCPVCIGQGHMPWGLGRRAKAIKMRAEDYGKHVAPAYSAVLGLFRHLEGRAARALIAVLGD
jgi:hypothetical protein